MTDLADLRERLVRHTDASTVHDATLALVDEVQVWKNATQTLYERVNHLDGRIDAELRVRTTLIAADPPSPIDKLAGELEKARAENDRLRRQVVHYDRCAAELVETTSALLEVRAERDALIVRRDELLALVARVTNETPFSDEAKDALAQRGVLTAEIGTLKAEVAESERRTVAAIAAWLERCGAAILAVTPDGDENGVGRTRQRENAEHRAAGLTDVVDALRAGTWKEQTK